MITASISGSSISMVGHASTQVCSAVSCLTQTLDLHLTKHNIKHDFVCESGNTKISCNYLTDDIAGLLFDFVIVGLQDIAKSYPNELTIIQQ